MPPISGSDKQRCGKGRISRMCGGTADNRVLFG